MKASSLIPRRAIAASIGAALLASLVASCGSAPVDRFYTLSGGSATQAPALAAPPLYFEMRPVSLPAQLRRPQLVLSTGDGRIALEEHHRWAGPLAEEIASSLSFGIAARLGAVDVYRSAAPKGSKVARIGADVQRFESRPGQYALVDVVWSVRMLDGGEVQTCRNLYQEPVGVGTDALVAGHRAVLEKLSATIALAVRAQAEGRAPACPAG